MSRISISNNEAAARMGELEALVAKDEATPRQIEEYQFLQEVLANSTARVPDDMKRSIKRVSTASLADVNPEAYAVLAEAKAALQ